MLLPLIVCIVFSMALGALWYSPVLFVNPWMKELGITGRDPEKAKKDMPRVMGIQLIATIVMALVLSWVVQMMGVTTALVGAKVGFMLWLGFMATVGVSEVVFEKRSVRWFFIHCGYSLVQMIVMGGILGGWKV